MIDHRSRFLSCYACGSLYVIHTIRPITWAKILANLTLIITMKGLFVSGSGTHVGKTFVAQQLIKLLSKSRTVKVRKPLESDCENIDGKLMPKDAELLSQACAQPEALDVVCPFRFEACASGEKASTDQGATLTLNQLVDACQVSNVDDFLVVEGAGGLYSPIAPSTLNSDLAQALKLPLVLVVKDELGAVNQALLCLQAAKKQNLTVAMLVLNQITPNTLENAAAIAQYTKVAVVEFNAINSQAFAQRVLSLVE